MASVHRYAKSGLNYLMKYKDADGKAILRSSGTTNYDEALKEANRREIAAADGLAPPGHDKKAHRWTLAKAVALVAAFMVDNKRRSGDSYARNFEKHVVPFFTADRMLSSITRVDLDAYLDHRRSFNPVPANAQLNNEMAALRRAFTLSMAGNHIARRPSWPPRLYTDDTIRQGFFETVEWDAVREHLPEWLADVMTLANWSGWRTQAELLPLEWSRVDPTAGVFRLGTGRTKSGKGREFHYASIPELVDVMARAKRRAIAEVERSGLPCRYVFHVDGEPMFYVDKHGHIVARHAYRTAWNAACAASGVNTACLAIGLPVKVPHDFRRTAVRRLDRVASRTLAKLVSGHVTDSTFERYAIANSDDVRDVCERVAAANPTAAPPKATRKRSRRAA